MVCVLLFCSVIAEGSVLHIAGGYTGPSAFLPRIFAGLFSPFPVLPNFAAKPLRLRGGAGEVKIVRTNSVEELNTVVVSTKNRMKETLTDFMRSAAIENPDMRELEHIFTGIQVICPTDSHSPLPCESLAIADLTDPCHPCFIHKLCRMKARYIKI